MPSGESPRTRGFSVCNLTIPCLFGGGILVCRAVSLYHCAPDSAAWLQTPRISPRFWLRGSESLLTRGCPPGSLRPTGRGGLGALLGAPAPPPCAAPPRRGELAAGRPGAGGACCPETNVLPPQTGSLGHRGGVAWEPAPGVGAGPGGGRGRPGVWGPGSRRLSGAEVEWGTRSGEYVVGILGKFPGDPRGLGIGTGRSIRGQFEGGGEGSGEDRRRGKLGGAKEEMAAGARYEGGG